MKSRKPLTDIDVIGIVGLICGAVMLSGIWWVPIVRSALSLP